MDRKWIKFFIAILNFTLVKGVVKVGALILVIQIVLWLWHGSWPDWSIKAFHNAGEAASAQVWNDHGDLPSWLQTPKVLSWIAWFFIGMPLFLFVPLAGWAAVGLFFLGLLLVVSILVQTSAFFRQVIRKDVNPNPKHIAICTDGTWNYPENIADGVTDGTNVFKFWDLLEGKRMLGREMWVGANRLKKHIVVGEGDDGKSKKVVKQIAFYYNGVGNKAEHTELGIKLGGMFGLGADRIVKNAYRDLIRFYRDGDSISICGFSRGAAIARLLAARVAERGLPRYAFSDLPIVRLFALPIAKRIGTLRRPVIDVLGVWDTVGAFGVSKSIMGIPFQRINLFKDLTVGQTVKKTVHMLALDEQRDAFIPTLITPTTDENREIQEVWFAGNHSNVGGGYAGNSLSNVPLRHLCKEAKVFKNEEALPLLLFRSEEDLKEQDANRIREKKKKFEDAVKKQKAEGRRALRPDELKLADWHGEDSLAPILYPPEGFADRVENEVRDAKVEKEESAIYENAPREVPVYDRVLDDTVRYKMLNDPNYRPAGLMHYYKRKKASENAYLELCAALHEGGHMSDEELKDEQALVEAVTGLKMAFCPRAGWLNAPAVETEGS